MSNIKIFNDPEQIAAITEKERLLESAKEEYRKATGKRLLHYMKEDPKLPDLLRKVIDYCQTKEVLFVKNTHSIDYMPDYCYYIILDGSVEVSVWSEDYSEGYSDFRAEYGENEIVSEDDFYDVVSDNELTGSELSSSDNGQKSYAYLIDLMKKAKEENPVSFYGILVENV